MTGRIVRWGALLGLGAVWWWALLRVALAGDPGALEGAVAAGGWGLSLLPVHTVSKARAVGAVGTGRWRAAWRVGDMGAGARTGPGAGPGEDSGGGGGGGVAGVSSGRRPGGGSDPVS
ncbi:hypothetical protein OQI_21755 [Streptomyces pharetrae CZA14]|uniref:Uncharacterized protein n=1 Tax=Streptomyces pharetrae CZA14 TaxID=1144883 RepID=A0ABX3YG28_9ACTN|nr:hypothetical protein OQI_21755 [Streptomyces pharetrae CZA14]